MLGWKSKLLIGGGVVVAAAVAFAGTAAAAGREVWKTPIELPSGDAILQVKVIICTCFRGGAKGRAELLACALKQIYSGDDAVPWPDIMRTGPMDGDDVSVGEALAFYGALVDEAIAVGGDDLALANWCGEPAVPGLGDLPFTPPTGKVDPPLIDPVPAFEFDTPQQVLSELLSERFTPGALTQVKTGMGGVEPAAKEALRSVGIMNPVYQELTLPLMRAYSEGSEWNRRLYSRLQREGEYWAHDGRHVGPAWLPRHKNAQADILNSRMPETNIRDTGAKAGPGSSFGLVWTPQFDVDVAKMHGQFVLIAADPPPKLLNLLT